MNSDETAKAIIKNQFLKDAGIEYPIICGAMYPCGNHELVAACSEAGGIGVVQPVTVTLVDGLEFREGLRRIKRLTSKPIAMNVLTEQSSKIYMDKMSKWVDIAVEEGVRFFVSSLGNPRWIVKRVESVGGKVYHDVTTGKWAMKALEGGVHGLIGVNNRAGGHTGIKTNLELYKELNGLGVPLISAGGIGSVEDFIKELRCGFLGVQMGTRFIATGECKAHDNYKNAILAAGEEDIILTEKLTGVPVSVIKTEYVNKQGASPNLIAKWLLNNPRTKHYMRMFYSLTSFAKLKNTALRGDGSYHGFYQAGKSVKSIDKIESAADIVSRFGSAWKKEFSQ